MTGTGKTGEQHIDYEGLAQHAMRGVVRAVLSKVAKTGLPGEHHFYVAFNTQAPGVTISKRLKEKYPEEMTIVLQHRFWDLSVQDDRFEVKLTFDAIPERLIVPFSAVKVFFDPSVPYGLQFEAGAFDMNDDAPSGDGDNQPDRADGVEHSAARGPRSIARPGVDRGDRKPPPRKPKIAKAGELAEGAAPAPAAPHPLPASTAAAGMVDASKTAASMPVDNGTAKVVQLDKFRKK